MFDLLKDVDKYKGIPPYASELYGVYQPLLGWQSALTKKWMQQGGVVIDPRIKNILDAHIKPAPEGVAPDHPLEMIALPLQPGSGRAPYTVSVAKALNSELINLLQSKVQAFVEAHAGRLPEGEEWKQLISIDNLMDQVSGDLRQVNDLHRERLYDEAITGAPGSQLSADTLLQIKSRHLQLMQYESQIAAFLLFHAEAQEGNEPNKLQELFIVQQAPPLEEILSSTDPLAFIDPNDNSGALGPVGFVQIFRQFFFDLGTFLGEPVEHIWVAPGTMIELVEVSTRRVLIERSIETARETVTRSEQSATQKDDLSDAIKEENQNSTKLGVSQTNTANLYVYQGSATATFGIDSTRTNARETAHRQTMEQTNKLSQEIKQNFKSVFRMVTETTDTRSRRYVLQNTSDRLINYELRRKMRRVGVQLQHVGTRLCWQLFVDDPGREIGVGQLVHIAEPGDMSKLGTPELMPYPPEVRQSMKLMLPFQRQQGDNDTGNMYIEDAPLSETGHIHLGDVNDKIKVNYLGHKVTPPPGYRLSAVQVKGVVGDHYLDPVFYNLSATGFDIHLRQAFFPVEGRLTAELELVFVPTDAEITRITNENESRKRELDAAKIKEIKESYFTAMRERIKLASNIRSRPAWDLREEERTVVYRALLRRLMLDSWAQDPKTPVQQRINHVRSELIRAIFDVDSMLYFVAPEWWIPRLHRSGQQLKPAEVLGPGNTPVPVTDTEPVGWGGVNELGRDNYKITDESSPARLGSSLGWLLQLDGDNLRNTFLNAPWVKAVVPIRPGREKAALNWLRSIEGHEDDGWDIPYLGTADEDAEFAGKTVGQVLEIIAERLEEVNGNIEHVLEADKVFEHGFDHLAGGFDAGVPAEEVFSQWISVLPTDQIVAAEYVPSDLMV
jgi:hypothetical protein